MFSSSNKNFEDKDATQPKREQHLFDVVLLDVPASKRMKVIDAMIHNDFYPDITLMEVMVMVFRLPNVVMHCCELRDAVILEMIFEVQGATVQIRPAHYCDEDLHSGLYGHDETKELEEHQNQDYPDKKVKRL
jgi:hypothetical protein